MNHISRRQFVRTAAGIGASVLLPDVLSAAPTAGVSDRPNILLFFPDQHRYDWLGPMPGRASNLPLETPNIADLAGRGIQFTNAYVAAPICGSSRATLAAGLQYDRTPVYDHGITFPFASPNFYRRLRASGYHVMACGKLDLDKGQPTWGLDGFNNLPEWGFSSGIDNPGKWATTYAGNPVDPYNDFLASQGLRDTHYSDMRRRKITPRLDPNAWGFYRNTEPTSLPEDAYLDNWTARNGLQLIRNAPAGKPWFLQVNFAGPHEPMDVTESMHARIRDRSGEFPQPRENTQLSAGKHQSIRRNYAAMIENIDSWLGTYIDELENRGELENTLIVYSSDHGEMLGDRNRWSKKLPFEPSVGVPLVIAGPDVREGEVRDSFVNVMDLAATFLDVAGADPLPDADSRTLWPILSGAASGHRKHLFSGLYGWRLVRDGRYKLVRGFDAASGPITNDGVPRIDAAEPMLYDLEADPWESENLAHAMPDRVSEMTEILREHVRPTPIAESPHLPAAFQLDGNYPNPFNTSTRIRYHLPEGASVRLEIFEMTGRRVATIVDGFRSAGSHTEVIDGSGWSSGAYLYRLSVGGDRESRTMTLLK